MGCACMNILKRFFKYFIYFVLGVVILIAGIVAYLIWPHPEFNLPKPTGQYAVGRTTYHWTDTTRKEIYSDDSEHPNRELMVNIWYPSQGTLTEKPTTPYAPYLIDYSKKKLPFVWRLECCPSHSYAQPEASLAHDVSPYPVIIFSHGLCCIRDHNTSQCEELASHGYVVVGISHTYDSLVVQFPDGRIVDGMKSIKERVKNKTAIEMLKQSDQNIEVWISDVRFVLDQLKQLANDKSSLFYQRFDQKNIGIFGHSFGGATAVQVCHRDARVKAGVNLDGFLVAPDTTKEFNKPFMFLLGDVTVKEVERPLTQNELKSAKISSPDEEKLFKSGYLPAIEQLAQSIDHDIYTFIFKDSGHMDFADSALIKSATRLHRLLIKLRVAGSAGMGSINGFRATEIVRAYLVNFFDKYLKGQPSELLDGKNNVYPEVKVKQWGKK